MHAWIDGFDLLTHSLTYSLTWLLCLLEDKKRGSSCLNVRCNGAGYSGRSLLVYGFLLGFAVSWMDGWIFMLIETDVFD